jgi:hypothetical protein
MYRFCGFDYRANDLFSAAAARMSAFSEAPLEKVSFTTLT